MQNTEVMPVPIEGAAPERDEGRKKALQDETSRIIARLEEGDEVALARLEAISAELSVDELRTAMAGSVLQKLAPKLGKVVEGLSKAAADATNRNQPGAARALMEAAGLTAKASVHIGDNYDLRGATIDASQQIHLHNEDRDALDEWRSRFNVR